MTDEAKVKWYDDLANVVEELHADNVTLRQAIRKTLNDNRHLADGDVCTLLALKIALRKVGSPWEGDELLNEEVSGRAW
jgi:hypothetical protein